ncbi:hypothetical protein DK846_08890 [Methanospirillum lacunae]|uniref:Uncharacterized protein n=1 Tax=Methanospirillum lacunae TaxID=668570 RepID=A0A2V2N2Z5_9EURY|nr:hypothetical protein DK846_08890 [Methanospirillum lacunae]
MGITVMVGTTVTVGVGVGVILTVSFGVGVTVTEGVAVGVDVTSPAVTLLTNEAFCNREEDEVRVISVPLDRGVVDICPLELLKGTMFSVSVGDTTGYKVGSGISEVGDSVGFTFVFWIRLFSKSVVATMGSEDVGTGVSTGSCTGTD